MSRILSLPFALGTCLISIAALAAPVPQRVRATIFVGPLHGAHREYHEWSRCDGGSDRAYRYLKLAPSSLAQAASRQLHRHGHQTHRQPAHRAGGRGVPPKLRGTGEGHYAWDRIPDTTLSSRAVTSSSMTNGTVTAATPNGTPSTVTAR